MRIDKVRATALVREAAAAATSGAADFAWIKKVEKLSQLCEEEGRRRISRVYNSANLTAPRKTNANYFHLSPSFRVLSMVVKCASNDSLSGSGRR